jgi:hypothetical protein
MLLLTVVCIVFRLLNSWYVKSFDLSDPHSFLGHLRKLMVAIAKLSETSGKIAGGR